ncbi:MAG: PQQ-dependent sugar dehydrogenase [Planctomycetaceae bacterium]
MISIPHPTNTNHNGGWIGFAPGGGTVLSITTGDGGGSNDPANNSQNTNTLLGKLLRIDVGAGGLDFTSPAASYSIPAGNMTVNPNSNLASPAPPSLVVRPEIYAYGLRNPWRNAYDRLTGDLYIADVGQGAREEINVIPAGRANTATLNQAAGSTNGINFGWRVREGTIATPSVGSSQLRNDDVAPVFDYVRSGTSGQLPFYGRSVTGGYIYRGPALHDFGMNLDGTYLFADYVSNQIGSFRYDVGMRALTDLRNRTSEIMGSLPAGVSLSGLASFAEDGLGNVYLLNASTGDVFRIAAAQPDGPRIDVAAGQSRTQSEAGYPLISGSFALRKTGAGRLVLTAGNLHSGATTIESGTLALASGAALAASSFVEVATAATLDVTAVAGGYDVPAGQVVGGRGTVAGSVHFAAGATLSPGASGNAATGLGGVDETVLLTVPEPAGLHLVVAAVAWAAVRRRRGCRAVAPSGD